MGQCGQTHGIKKKINKNSYQYNKISPRPNTNTKWVHEGTGVIFSNKSIGSLLNKHNFKECISEIDILKFTDYVKKLVGIMMFFYHTNLVI